MAKLEPEASEALEVAGALIGGAVEVSRLSSAGRNSRIWKVRSGERAFALKQYPPLGDDPRDRLATEAGALRLMERCCFDQVPRVLGVDGKRGYALLSWVDGSHVTDIRDDDIDAAIDFLAAVHRLRLTEWAIEQPPASEACLSGREIERQITARAARLRACPDEPQLIDFIDDFLDQVMRPLIQKARAQLASTNLDFAAELPQEWCSLVPSDFGFHNSLRRSDGSLAFVDFEYFGWDDPVKLTADILLHPGSVLSALQRRRFRNAALRLYGEDPAFAVRLRAFAPLFGLRWVLILLNEFIPERWQRRVLAGNASDWGEAKARQLVRARQFLTDLPEKLED